jgi:hypothetical protein
MINHPDIVPPLDTAREKSNSTMALPLRMWSREQLALPSTSAKGVIV